MPPDLTYGKPHMTSQPEPRPRRLTPGLLAVLGLLATMSPLSTDMYLASFTDIAQDLDTTASSVQLTLTAFLFGIGAGQLFFGPLSDRRGRRPVLLGALAVATAAGAAIVFVPHIAVFVVLRFVQGFTGSAGVVLARAIAVDLTEGAASVRALSLIATLVGLGPLIAPPIGGVVAEHFGWRAVLALLAAITAVMLLLAWVVVPESLPPERRHHGGLASTNARFLELLRDPVFLRLILAFAFAFAAMMSYISASPFVGQVVLQMSTTQYSIAFSAGATALILANLINARVATTIGPVRMLMFGITLVIMAALGMAVLTFTGTLEILSFIPAAFVLTGGVGFVMSNASALALARAPHARGSGSALLGASQFLFGGIVTPLVGLGGEHTAVPMVLAVAGCALIAFAFALAARARM